MSCTPVPGAQWSFWRWLSVVLLFWFWGVCDVLDEPLGWVRHGCQGLGCPREAPGLEHAS